jgi:hypothetical protein
MEANFELNCEALPSMGELLLRFVVTGGEERVFDRIVNAFDNGAAAWVAGEVARATSRELGEVERVVQDLVSRERDRWNAGQAAREDAQGFRGQLMTSQELEESDLRHSWLIKNVLVQDQPALLGGPKKSMKTSVMLDMAVSLGSGRRFLGRFEVPERKAVAVLSGESGQITIRETALRIARAKGVKLGDCQVLWGFELPRLGVEEDLSVLAGVLRENNVGVVFIDPAYLCLLSGSPDLQANNMFQVGPLLMRVARLCQEAGATVVLVHHTSKQATMNRALAGDPLDLEDLAYAGFQEFARQWLLVNRRQKYTPGSGLHELWLNIGGSAGHSGCWGIDVDEGRLNDDFSGRRWDVQVRTMEEAYGSVVEARRVKKEGEKRQKEAEQNMRVREAMRRFPDGETMTKISAAAGLEPRVVGPILEVMVERGAAVRTQVTKSGGRGNRTYDGYRLRSGEEAARERVRNLVIPRPGGYAPSPGWGAGVQVEPDVEGGEAPDGTDGLDQAADDMQKEDG